MRAPEQSDDSLAITLLCAHLASPKASGLRPLIDSEWAALAERIANSTIRTPSSLFGLSPEQLQAELGLEPLHANRIVGLLARSGSVAFELERFASMGIWVMTRADNDYPRDVRRRLRSKAPAVLFGIGSRNLLSSRGIAIVGSRDLDDAGLRFANRIGHASARSELTVYSGASRGADITAMRGCLDAGGRAVGVVSDGLEKSLRDPSTRELMTSGMLCLASPFHPGTSFRASNAMARNKIVYCLSTLAIVVATGYSKGGTWTGAVEALKAKWVPVFVRVGDLAPPANQKLMEIGARPLVEERVGYGESLLDWLRLVAAGTSDSDPTPSSAIDLFTLAWPSIAAFLTTPRSEDDISRRFDLVPSQVSHWLLRAEAKGEANRTLNGWVVDSTDKDVWQESLFSDG